MAGRDWQAREDGAAVSRAVVAGRFPIVEYLNLKQWALMAERPLACAMALGWGFRATWYLRMPLLTA